MPTLRIGYIVKPHGIHGELRLRLFDARLWEAHVGAYIYCNTPIHGPWKISAVRPLHTDVLIQLAGVITRDTAEQFSGCAVSIDIDVLPPGVFFIKDIIGAAVKTTDGRLLGTLQEVLSTNAHDVYRVINNRREILIPALKSVVKRFDSALKTMVVELPDGLEDTVS